MSLVINTNFAATLASNNLATANTQLQKSLNRLSSGSKIVNPADDAGGLAVSMKLSAAAKRQGAVLNNIGNSVSYLQTQDGALKVASKVLDRISELKALAADPTKNSSDVANYNVEFTELKAQLTAVAGEKFNGVALFGSSTLDVATTESGGGVINTGGVDLLGAGSGSSWSAINAIDIGANWNESPPGSTANWGNSDFIEFIANGTVSSTQNNISGPYSMSFDYYNNVGSNAVLELTIGGATLDLTAAIGDAPGTFNIQIDHDGTQTTYSINGGAAVVTPNISTPGGGAIAFSVSGHNGQPTQVLNFSITPTGTGGGSGNISAVTSAASLGALGLSTVTNAIQDLATHRAANGAQQSRLGFAAELLTVNKANLEAATSRIIDVDVAAESTQLARYNVLVQSGTSMLGQANQTPQSVLRLLG